MRRGLISSALCVAAALGLAYGPSAQAPSQPFRTGTHTVSIYATVVDADRRLIPNLTKADFVVYDNGKPQPVTVFENTARPISIVIMLDRSSSMFGNFDLVRDAAEQFLGNLLPADRARVGSFSNRVQIDPPVFTSDREELVRVLHHDLQEAGPTPLWNATSAAMNALALEEGRRVVLLFTDGKDEPDPTEQRTTMNEVIHQSQADDIMVYAVGLADKCTAPAAHLLFQRRGGGGRGGGRGPGGLIPRGVGSGQRGGRRPPRSGPIGGGPGVDVFGPGNRGGDGRGGDGRTGGGETFSSPCRSSGPDPGLKLLADVGGGAYFELHGTDDLGAALARVAEELHHQYTIGFTAAQLDGNVHTLDVRVTRPHVTVRARKSYVAARE
jgi:VWFA-related protein